MNNRLLIMLMLWLLTSCKVTTQSTSYEYRNMSFDAISDTLNDQSFNYILAPYKDSLERVMSQVIGETADALVSSRPESPLSNLISDMALHYATVFCQKNNYDFVPQFSLINHGSLRTSLPKGEITLRYAFELMPFENELILLQLNGKQVIELCNYIATRKGEGVSGISFGLNEGRAEKIMVQGMRIDEGQKYWMVTSDYIANGGDGMKVLTWVEQRMGMETLIRDMIIEEFQEKHSKNTLIQAKSDGRLYHVQ